MSRWVGIFVMIWYMGVWRSVLGCDVDVWLRGDCRYVNLHE